jgi:hypothetical protein
MIEIDLLPITEFGLSTLYEIYAIDHEGKVPPMGEIHATVRAQDNRDWQFMGNEDMIVGLASWPYPDELPADIALIGLERLMGTLCAYRKSELVTDGLIHEIEAAWLRGA